MLRRYRWEVVRPRIAARDLHEYLEACSKAIPVLGVSYAMLEPNPGKLSIDMLNIDVAPGAWRNYRAWAVIRISGRWPAPVWGSQAFPLAVDLCPFCHDSQITVLHPLFSCPHFSAAYVCIQRRWGLPDRSRQADAIFALFGRTCDVERLRDVIHFVGSVTSATFHHSELPASCDDCGSSLDQQRLDALILQTARDQDELVAPLGPVWDDVLL